ncbi:MAG: macro domain-containing protein [Phycisphaerae bacterium]
MTEIHINQGDLTTMQVDAIVNAANNDLILGGGLAGAIAMKGGPDIQAGCDKHGPIQVGQAAMTTAGDLPARYVIHQASMRLGGSTTAESLARSTQAVLRIAEMNELSSLAFPAVGTGIAGFPLPSCAEIMLGEVKRHLVHETHLEDIYFILVDAVALQTFKNVYERLFSE